MLLIIDSQHNLSSRSGSTNGSNNIFTAFEAIYILPNKAVLIDRV